MRFKRDCEVLVVGGGPVGLFAALSLAERGVDVQIIDKDYRGSVHSYALAIHPRTLQLLRTFDLAQSLVERGHRVQKLAFYDRHERIGELDFTGVDADFPFLLVLPQSALETTLVERLKRSGVGVFWDHQAMTVRPGRPEVGATVARMESLSMGYPVMHTERMVAKEFETRCRFLIGADGYHSFTRKAIGASFENLGSAQAFLVFEFPAQMEFPAETRVVFRDGRANVLWPLGEGRGRWSFGIDADAAPDATLENLRGLAAERAPWFRSTVDEFYWSTTALFEKRLTDRFGADGMWLVGDAAHITGPVGAQSMNVGLREAHELADRLATQLRGEEQPELLRSFEAGRRAEWRRLLGAEGRLVGGAGRLGQHAASILPCIPGSGEDLQPLLDQLGLRLE